MKKLGERTKRKASEARHSNISDDRFVSHHLGKEAETAFTALTNAPCNVDTVTRRNVSKGIKVTLYTENRRYITTTIYTAKRLPLKEYKLLT